MSEFEGEADIIGAVGGCIAHQRMPVFNFELGGGIRQIFKGFGGSFDIGSMQLYLLGLCHDCLQVILCSIKLVCQVSGLNSKKNTLPVL